MWSYTKEMTTTHKLIFIMSFMWMMQWGTRVVYQGLSHAQFIRNTDIKFSCLRLETNWWDNNIAVVNTHLVAVKDGVRYPGPIEM